MEKLAHLLSLVDSYCPNSDQILLTSLKGAPKSLALLNYLRETNRPSDEGASSRLYGTRDADRKLREIKERLHEKLMNCLLLVHSASLDFNKIENAYFDCLRVIINAYILGSKRSGFFYIEELEVALKKAEKYEFTYLGLLIAERILGHYGFLVPNATKFNRVRSTIARLEETRLAEFRAVSAKTELFSKNLDKQSHIGDQFLAKAISNAENLQNEFGHINSRNFLRLTIPFYMAIEEFSGNLSTAIDIGKIGLSKFDAKAYETFNSQMGIYLRLISCLTKNQDFEEAKVFAKHCSENCEITSQDWNTVAIYRFIVACHSREYEQAQEIFLSARSVVNFRLFHASRKQLWHVNEAYIHFLIRRGKISEQALKDKSLKPFRLYKFLNDVPIYAKDKRGVNISILIIHVLFLLDQRKFSRIHERVDALNQYCYRYLRRDDTFRSNCFIKMLIQVPKADFNRIRTERYAKKYYDKLLSMPLSQSRQGIETEVMPYEHLWEMVLEMLD